MKTELVPIGDISFGPYNWKTHNARQRNLMKASLSELGFIAPVVVNSQTGNLLDGYLRVLLADEMGARTVPVVYVNVPVVKEELATFLLRATPDAAPLADRGVLLEVVEGLDADNPYIQRLIRHICHRNKIVPGG